MIIGICGHLGAGKTTVTNVAINVGRPERPYVQMGFSDPLYRMLEAMGLPKQLIYDKTKWSDPQPLLCGRSIRHACDTLGNDWGRELIGVEVWANAALERAREFERSGLVAIIDNVRYRSEARQVLQAGGKLIAFHRTGLTPDLSKPSEREIPRIQSELCEYQFTNSGNILQQDAANFRMVLDTVSKRD